jgi:uncharacterized repeat protein (TIGR03803 family)
MKSESTSTASVRLASSEHSIKRMKPQWPTLAFVIVLALAAFAIPSAQAQKFKVLYTFKGSPDGALPLGTLIIDAKGNLYGTTSVGGASEFGSVFKLTPANKETLLYSFTGGTTDGEAPQAGVIMDAKGNLYGTTELAGASANGTVFKLAGNKEKVLHSFAGGTDGAIPIAGVILDSKGNLYGTTLGGGAAFGTVFTVNPTTDKESVVYDFSLPNGAVSTAGLIMDKSGNFYGTTTFGGDLSCNNTGCGVVFKLSGKKETVLYSFTGSKDGASPHAVLLMDAAGNLYGTTYYGGGTACGGKGCGTVFKVSKAGKETVLHRFTGGKDGASPEAGLVMDASGNLYGTTYYGGSQPCSDGCGVVFEVSAAGKETVLHSFTGKTDGAHPYAGLVMDAAGNLYGTAETGGDASCIINGGCGTVFKITP